MKNNCSWKASKLSCRAVKTSGFTLIELLIVIAIIGILAAVVLASLNTARDKGANATIKSTLHNLRSQTEIVNDNNGYSYDKVCNATQDPNVAKAIATAHSASAATGAVVTAVGTVQVITTSNCHSSSAGWAISVPLKKAEGSNLYWCTDYTGVSIGRINPLAANSVTCPTS